MAALLIRLAVAMGVALISAIMIAMAGALMISKNSTS